MANPHDSFFHFIFGPPERAAELLRTALPATLATAIDWTTLARHDTRLDDGRGDGIEADLVFTAAIAGKPAFLCVLVEHKSSDDPMTAFQLLRYVVRIWERHRHEHPASQRLPPVLPFVLYHGEGPWQSSQSLRGIVDLEGLPRDVALALLAVQPELRFVLDDLAQQTEADLQQRTSTVSVLLTLLCMQHLRHAGAAGCAAALARWEPLLEAMVHSSADEDTLGALLFYIGRTAELSREQLRAALAHIHPRVEDMIMQRTGRIEREALQRGWQEGMAKGQAEGMAEGMAKVVLGQLQHRFGPLSESVVARVRSASSADVERWAAQILTASSLDEALAPAVTD